MKELQLLNEKIEEKITLIAFYRAKKNLEYWEEISLENAEEELSNYQSILAMVKIQLQVNEMTA